MLKKVFDSVQLEEYRNLKNLLEKNKITEEKIKSFLEKYSEDSFGLMLYISFSIKHRNLNKSLENYLKLEDMGIKLSEINPPLFSNLVRLCYHLGEYKKVYELFPELTEDAFFTLNQINYIKFFLEKELGLLSDVDINKLEYLYRQAYNYSPKIAYDYIVKYNEVRPEKSYFDENINIDELIKLIESYLPKAKMSEFSGEHDIYYFYYKGIGYYEETKEDYLKVTTIRGTHNIVNMYPYKNPEEDVCIIESYLPTNEVKSLSQINKFNARYGIK